MIRHHGRHPERRKHPRFPVVGGLIEPISLRYVPECRRPAAKAAAPVRSQPAILTNLSAGGMSLITFVEPPHAKRLEMDLNLPGLNHVPLVARVVRMHQKGETYNVGIQFTSISRRNQLQINLMAADHMDCETRIALSLPEACVPACRFHPLCHKPQKAPHWPPKV